MYFEIDNTPEHIKIARRADFITQEPREQCPRLVLAPFTKPPQVVFDNVFIGNTCDKELEIYNPTKQIQQITLEKSLPPGLEIQLPGEWLELEPETCYCLSMRWTPMQPMAIREVIRFTNDNRRRFDVIVILKSSMNIKSKTNPPKGKKKSPGKIKKKVAKKSPMGKKKTEIIYTTKIMETINVHTTEFKNVRVSNKENLGTVPNCSVYYYQDKCPFDSPASGDFNFNTSEVFSNARQLNLHDTYDKSYTANTTRQFIHQNVLKPINKQYDSSTADLFDNLTFTPLKSLPAKVEKLEKGPKVVVNIHSDSPHLDDSLEVKNNENDTHSIISITSSQPNKWLTTNIETQFNSQCVETPTVQNKKHPDTSSPKEFNSPNFSINTEFSRISDLSFFPQKVSTEKKCFPKTNNDTHDVTDDIKISSDTYTKESPNTLFEPHLNQLNEQKPHFFQQKICRQALFKEHQFHRDNFEKYFMSRDPNIRRNEKEFCEKYYLNPNEHNPWENYYKMESKSPSRSVTPPLQSIPEESCYSDAQLLNNTNKQADTFTTDSTFDKSNPKPSVSSNRPLWSKKAVRVEPNLWKIPESYAKNPLKPKSSVKSKDFLCGKKSNCLYDDNKSIDHSLSINQFSNVYSQSFTVDPFMSNSYFYDEKAVNSFEKEFKRWLNYILTPPADLESNVDQKIDIGKAWIENRSKDIPLAPTKEQVSSIYHNNHRLQSLRRAARALLMSSEIVQVLQKLNVQIDKKLIAIRTDRNLHLDVGLQKIILELLLSYNPLWLRMGLEAIYGLIIPLKSNSDIEGLTTFIIHRMFKNPYLKNKHSKLSAPNMLLPAYMEAIKKFTLKKFFMLVFFLDQAKQKKLISHDPCLFCRNAICKESREIIIRFTRELIAGIGDITKHLRPLGYVVYQKQSYLDEYKYAVNNIAVDIRDGVRLTKVMEIILIKKGLLNQLRTPAISRLQKIHNVQVALNALKEANFVIVGDITASDIADGHREKTLSLLWQIIHVFRAPLFEKASNIIQAWWRKKYAVIVQKRRQEAEERQKINYAASVIQWWWRQIQYNRLVQYKMQQNTTAAIVLQKYWRMWLCRTQLRKLKSSVAVIENWYKSMKLVRAAKFTLYKLRLEREEMRRNSATILQSYVRRWLCMKRYKIQRNNITTVQSMIRCYLARSKYLRLKICSIYIQQKFRSKQLMKQEMKKFHEQKRGAIVIQSYYRMIKQYRTFQKLKNAVITIENRYIALIKMRIEHNKYLELKKYVIIIQAQYRRKIYRTEFLRNKNLIIQLQRKVRAKQAMEKERKYYLQKRNATMVLQIFIRSYLCMKTTRLSYLKLRESAILIQRIFRSYLLAKAQRKSYIELRAATIILQKYYRNILLMRKEKLEFLNIKNSAIIIQRRYRAQLAMRKCKENYAILRKATIAIQRKYRAHIQMRKERTKYMELKSSCIVIQNAYRAYVNGKQQRQKYLIMKSSCTKIQNWFRNCKKGKQIKQEYEQSKNACVFIQRIYRSYTITKKQRQQYIRIRTATICIQKYYRGYIEMKTVRQEFIKIRSAIIVIQRFYRSRLETKKVMDNYLRMKAAANCIVNYYRRYKEAAKIKQTYLELRRATQIIQMRFRSILAMKIERQRYLKLRQSVVYIQNKYRALLRMRQERQKYLSLRSAAVTIQLRYRANVLMKLERAKYLSVLKACNSIQKYYRAYVEKKKQRQCYLKLKESVIIIQGRYKALLQMRKERDAYLKTRAATIIVQRRYRARCQMIKERQIYMKVLEACVTIQRFYRAYKIGKKLRTEYNNIRTATIIIQTKYRMIRECRSVRNDFLKLRETTVFIQRRFRDNKLNLSLRQNEAAAKIQRWYISTKRKNLCRFAYLKIIKSLTIIQSTFRMYVVRKRYIEMKRATVTIQKYYRSYKLMLMERRLFVQKRFSIIKLQSHIRACIKRKQYLRLRAAVLTIQSAYRYKRLRDRVHMCRHVAAICIQKNIRRYLQRSRYADYRNRLILIQRIWKAKILTRLLRCEFLQKRNMIIRFQARLRGFLVRKSVQCQREILKKRFEKEKIICAVTRIQALYRGHKVRLGIDNKRLEEIRKRRRDGSYSNQETLKERNKKACVVFRNVCDIETVINAFKSLENLTALNPMMYNATAPAIVRRVFYYMSYTNRSISSIELLMSAGALLVNFTRYSITGPKIYERDRVPIILKFMLRFSNSDPILFCILATYLWLFAKYDNARKDLTDFLHISENHKMLMSMKGNIDRMKRMTSNAAKHKFHMTQPSPSSSHAANKSVCRTNSSNNYILPASEPDYNGVIKTNRPRYFEDAHQAISCLFDTYNL